MKQNLIRYWLAMNVSAVQSSALAGKAWLAAAGAHVATGGQLPAIEPRQLAGILAFAFVQALIYWLADNPLPTGGVATLPPPAESKTAPGPPPYSK
jgi:hypothetical protein